MAGSEISPAKTILLAIQFASASNITLFESLVARSRKTLHKELVLRILLSYLPEILESSKYAPFLERLDSGELDEDAEFEIGSYQLEGMVEEDAKRRARKLHLRSLSWPYEAIDETPNVMVRFLVLRALQIDESIGLITEVPALLEPFLDQSTYLRTWLISTILPLLRFSFEYHTNHPLSLSIPKFEELDNKAGVRLLLSQTGQNKEDMEWSVGRDLRGLVGTWMYGDTRWKRRRPRLSSGLEPQAIPSLDETSNVHEKCLGWEEVFKWIAEQAGASWEVAVRAIEQWDGPGDVDIGEYSDGSIWLDEDEQQYLEKSYARVAMATAYLVLGDSEEALTGIHRIVERIVTLLDIDPIPNLQSAASMLAPVFDVDENLFSENNAFYLRNYLLNDRNVLTKPNEDSILLLRALLLSTYLCMKSGSRFAVRRAGELVLLQNEREQKLEFDRLVSHVSDGPKGDDKYWVKLRNEVLWLRSWGAEELSDDTNGSSGKGIFGKLPKDYVESKLLELLLANTRYTLANSIYELSPDRPLSREILEKTVIAAAMNAYDNATNANKTRGGVKKCSDILQAFPDTLIQSLISKQAENLINVTHLLGDYRLMFKQGEPFRPVSLRVHGDPISIIGKLLEQNTKSYLKINNLVQMGSLMVKAGLTVRDTDGTGRILEQDGRDEQLSIAKKRVVSMCIDTACAEEDFETAYSYVVTRLNEVAGPAQSCPPYIEKNQCGLSAEVPPKTLDDWSWKAALQTGKYKHISNSHGNGSTTSQVRHVEQRIECLSYALRLAPKSALHEILNVFRRAEEELKTAEKEEAEEEYGWDDAGDEQVIPGGFHSTPARGASGTSSRATEEAPMSLFDLSKASISRAQTGFSALSMLRRDNVSEGGSELWSPSSVDGARGAKLNVRKRDQLKNAAVGGLATGIGWVLGAPPARSSHEEER
ncbi:Sec39 domain-containing protein [Amylocarpus encephaloides]|uniref:Sec39 domain-containing protein n=1 Tax=Amylocarpus encephaloides TaxID=45428 RepID=A0A9P7YIW0_9HELO|nr:Sec39 domain-containing protein [Amylocarpus encephaloides]